MGQTLTITKYRSFLQRGQFRHPTCQQMGMSIYDRLTQYHAESRPSFILFTEFIAFVGTMATMVGISFLRELLG
jgi:hypothetical protein